MANVLLVEDEIITHNIIRSFLNNSGYRAISAYDGEQALAIIKKCEPIIDWVVTDISLPGLVNGWIVASEFHFIHPRRPVIYVTSQPDDAFRRTSGSYFLRKPVIPAMIVEILRQEGAA